MPITTLDRLALPRPDLSKIDAEAPIGQGHAAAVDSLVETLVLACNGRAIVSSQNPVRLNRTSEPRPDLAILQRRVDLYATGKRPRPSDVPLLVEVADTSLNFDRDVKLPLYARAGIGECWIVDLKRPVLDAYKAPIGDKYHEMTTYQPGDIVTLAPAPDILFQLDLVFGE